MSLEFLITALIVVLVPGTGVVYTVAVGLGKGRRAALAATIGCTLGRELNDRRHYRARTNRSTPRSGASLKIGATLGRNIKYRRHARARTKS